MAEITKDIGITDLAEKYPEVIPVLLDVGMHCIGCMAAQFETLEQGCAAHGLDVDEVIKKINNGIKDKRGIFMVTVKKELCIGCGACVSICPQAFEMGDDGKSKVKDGNADCVESAKNACPVAAIE